MFRRDFLKGTVAAGLAAGNLHPQLLATEDGAGQSTDARRRFPHRANVIKIEDLTHNIKRIRLQATSREFTFTAGQHVMMRVPESFLVKFNDRYDTNHKTIYRPYSFASSPSNSSSFDLIIKHYPAPKDKDVPPGVASTYVHQNLQVGDSAVLSEPRGRLYAKNDSDRPIIVVAGGVGAAPFIGLLNYWFENQVNQQRKLYFFLGVRSRRDLLLHDEFTEWTQTESNFEYVPALSHPQDGDAWIGETGYINVVLAKYFQKPIDADVYLAGPPIMIKFTREVLKKKGIDADRIYRDPIRVR